MLLLIILLGIFSVSNCLVSIPPCNLEEITCSTNFARAIYVSAISGDPNLGIRSLDPMQVGLVEAVVPNLTFTLRNSVTHGYKSCVVEKSTLTKTADNSTMRLEIYCPYLNMSGQYEMDGKIAHLPIKGKGDYDIETSDYYIEINGEVKFIEKDSEKYIHIDKFSYKTDLQGSMRLDLKNLFDGNKELADPVHKFIEEHPVLTAEILSPPAFNRTTTMINENFNKQLQTISITKFVA